MSTPHPDGPAGGPPPTVPRGALARRAVPSSLRLEANVDHLERRLIRAALVRTGGKRSAAARLLGVSRNGLAMKMERLGLGAAGGNS